ncbi:hypothetical protein Godav_028266 [Gossypium davidsonii]|uniref:Uncharacterized protein n=2 Tax=Gossypium TaxID=3633 RepID=A0A7J8RYU1_GOSDV|nr:hypothetical protein [Gossypium davidsonii]MBA0654390.1 hypothetical protein [Gossypium klotzschianum]
MVCSYFGLKVLATFFSKVIVKLLSKLVPVKITTMRTMG